MIRTVEIKLDRTPDLVQTVRIFNEACQSVLDWGQENKVCNKTKLHRATYRAIRSKYPTLPSALVQTARDQASEMLRRHGYDKHIRKKYGSAIRYDRRTISILLKSGYCSICTIFGRMKYNFILPKNFVQYEDWSVKSSQIKVTQEHCWLKVTVEGGDKKVCNGDKRLGIDLGINNIAVCSDNTFYNSKHWKDVKGKYMHQRAELQSKGTRSARRKLKELSGRERRFVKDLNHQLSKEIVHKPYSVLVLEDLTAIRGRKNKKIHNKMLGQWSYSMLRKDIEYKAETLGKRVLVIQPYHTSQTCSKCGLVSRANRKGRQFKCVECGFTLDADLNASRNIAIFSRRIDGRPTASRPNVTCHDSVMESKHSCKSDINLSGS